jgi:hypothetical protein
MLLIGNSTSATLPRPATYGVLGRPGELYLSSKTVRNAVSGIYAKLHAPDRAAAIIKAREAGLGQG